MEICSIFELTYVTENIMLRLLGAILCILGLRLISCIG